MRSVGIAWILITIVVATIVVFTLKWILIPIIGADRAEAAASFMMWLIMWSIERGVLWLIMLGFLAGALAMLIKPVLDFRRHRKLRPFMFIGGLLLLYVAWVGLGMAWISLFDADTQSADWA